MIVYTDGSRIPGQDSRGYAGIGIWFGNADCRNTSISLTTNNPTNQLAELLAIHYALKFCKDAKSLTIKTDSKYSIKSITEWSKTWLRNGWKTSKGEDVVNSTTIKDILETVSYRKSKSYTTLFQHVYGHRGEEGNDGADKLAVAASLKRERYVMDNTIYFDSSIDGNYKCFSQFYPCIFSVKHDGKLVEYNCVEQYHQQQKAVLFGDYYCASKVMESSSPTHQRELGRSVKEFNEDTWFVHCYEICKKCTVAKFTQNPDLLQILMSTKNNWLAHESSDDCVWGTGVSATQSKSKVKWRGKNLLGKVLEDARDSILEYGVESTLL